MKKVILLICLLVSIVSCAQKRNKTAKPVVIAQKVDVKQKGIQLVLKNVINDSRCPEGVQCIWAGEIELAMAIYKDGKIIEEENIVMGRKYEETLAWFSKYYPGKKLKKVAVLPYPKDGETHDLKDYFIQLGF